jgi:hypothetical protein
MCLNKNAKNKYKNEKKQTKRKFGVDVSDIKEKTKVIFIKVELGKYSYFSNPSISSIAYNKHIGTKTNPTTTGTEPISSQLNAAPEKP